MRHIIILVVALLATTVMGCGRSDRLNLTSQSGTDLRGLDANVEAIRNYPTPEMIDVATWNIVRDELIKQLTLKAKTTLAAPTGFANAVDDLSFTIDYDAAQATLTWTEKLAGDYDNNGEVGVGDITPIVIYFGANSTDANWPTAKIADGDNNGEVNLSDITPIVLNFQFRLEGYQVRRGFWNGSEVVWETPIYPSNDPHYPRWTVARPVPPIKDVRPTYTYIDDLTSTANASNRRYVVIPCGDYQVGVWGNEAIAPNLPPTAEATADPTDGVGPLTVDFDGSGSFDPDGTLADYLWLFGDGASAHGLQSSHTYADIGMDAGYNAVLQVTDSYGLVANSAPITILVARQPDNQPPTALGTADPTFGLAPLTVEFDASESLDPDGSIVSYQWDEGDVMIGNTMVTSYEFSNAGPHTVTLTVTDDGGATDDYDLEVSVTNTPPVANLTADPMTGETELWVNFDASGSTDNDGVIILYEWDFHSDGFFERQGEASTTSNLYPVVGTFDATVRVTDNLGGVDTTSVRITVTPSTIGGGDWWMFGREPTHNRLSPFVGPQTNNLDWSYPTSSDVRGSPAIAGNGTIYVGNLAGILYAMNPDGSLKWEKPLSGQIFGSPAIGSDGTIYVANHDGYFDAVRPDGSVKWRLPLTGIMDGHPAIGENGMIYIGNTNGYLYAITTLGTLDWRYQTGDKVRSSPAIGENGTIYVGSDDGYLYAIYPSGSLRWRYPVTTKVFSSPAIGYDGTIYVGSYDSYLYAINSNGTLKWKHPVGASVNSSPGIGPDNTIYVGSNDGNLYAIREDGTLKWSYPTGGMIESSPAIDANGVIYIGSEDHFLYAINADGTLKWSYETNSGVRSSPSIGSDGTVYVGSNDYHIYAFHDAL